MQKLNQAITDIDVFIPPIEYINKILSVICNNLGYTFATVIVLDEKSKGKMIASYNLPDDFIESVHRIDAPILSSPSGEAIETGKIVVSDSLLEPRLKPWIDIIHTYSLKTHVWVPLFRGGDAFGTCVLYDTTKRQVSDAELRALEQIGVIVSIAIISNRYLGELMHKTKALEVEIGERKNAEEALQIAHGELELRIEERTAELFKANKNLQLFRNLTDKLNDFIFIIDPDTSQIIDVNASACLELGYERRELIGRYVTDFSISFSDIHQWNAHVTQVAKTGSCVLEDMYRRKNCAIFPVEINTRLVVQDGVRLILETVRNIAKRKIMDEALCESRRKISTNSRIVNAFLTSSDEDIYQNVLNIILDVMESKHGIFGYMDKNGALVCPSMTRNVWDKCQITDEIIKTFEHFEAFKAFSFPPESWGGLWGKALTEKRPIYSNGGFNVPGGHIPMSRFLVVPIIYQGVVIGTINVANKKSNYDDDDRNLLESIADHIAPILNARLERDYEDKQRKNAEKTLKASQEKYSTIVEKGNDGIIIIQDGIIKFVNKIEAEITGYSKDETCGKSFLKFVTPKYRKRVNAHYKNRLHGHNTPNGYEMEIISKSGKSIPVETNAGIIEYEGRPATLVIIRDITERKQAEEAISYMKNYLETIITMSYDGILVVDSEGRFEFGNNALYNILGWPQDELIGESFMKVFPADYHEHILERWAEVQRGEGEPYETVIVTKNGKRKNLLVSHTDMMYAGERKYCVVIKDITSDLGEYIKMISDILDNDA